MIARKFLELFDIFALLTRTECDHDVGSVALRIVHVGRRRRIKAQELRDVAARLGGLAKRSHQVRSSAMESGYCGREAKRDDLRAFLGLWLRVGQHGRLNYAGAGAIFAQVKFDGERTDGHEPSLFRRSLPSLQVYIAASGIVDAQVRPRERLLGAGRLHAPMPAYCAVGIGKTVGIGLQQRAQNGH